MKSSDKLQTGVGSSQQSDALEQQYANDIALTLGQTGLYPQFILFGDSITQQASLTVQARLQTLYIRRADIVNRGFSGYTTALALSALPYFLPPSTPVASSIQPPIRLLTIFFGANDACLPGNAQHIQLELYVANLRRIAEYPVFRAHSTKIIFITPAPVNEWQLSKPLTRTATNASCYAEAVRGLAKEMQIPCIDLWTVFMKLATLTPSSYSEQQQELNSNNESAVETIPSKSADTEVGRTPAKPDCQQREPSVLPGSLSAPPSQVLSNLLHDGLHFSPQGYEVFFNELVSMIQKEVPDCTPESLPVCFRDWKDILGVDTTSAAAVAKLENEADLASTLTSQAEARG